MKLVFLYFLCLLLIQSSFGNPCRKRNWRTPPNILFNFYVTPIRIYNIVVNTYINKPPDLPIHTASHLLSKTSKITLPTTTKSRPTITNPSTFSPISSDPIISHPNSSPANNPKSDFNPTKHPNWKLVNDEKCGINIENRIVGGQDASLGQYPWIARIGYSNKENRIVFKCGATLISRTHVVTAAHCAVNVSGALKVAVVRLGEYHTETDIDCVEDLCASPHKDYAVDQVLVHKYYGTPINGNDIALIKLNETVQFTNWIAPICLPFGSLLQKNITSSMVDIAGWGLFDVTNVNGSTILQTVKLPVIKTSVCIEKFRRYVINKRKQLCVGGIVGKDSCSGDSGGPLMKVAVEGGDGPKYYLFGIVSFGATLCGMTKSPAIYTKVVGYMKWILDHLTSD